MAAYLALAWRGEAPPTVAQAREALGEGWTVAHEAADGIIFVRSARAPRIRRLQAERGVVIGDLHRRSFRGAVGDDVESLIMSRASPVSRMAQDLCERFWGRYVALIQEPAGGVAVLRDPSGALEAMTWTRGDVQYVGSHLPDWLPSDNWPEALAIDWPAVGRWIRAPGAIGGDSALAGVRAVTPGAVLGSAGDSVQIWSPTAAARARAPGDPAHALQEVVDGCVRQLAGDEILIAEVSGGLDSAIVASSLATQARHQVAQWTNYYVDGRRGDERAYARAVAARWDLPLTEVRKPDFAVTEAMLARVAGGLRPGVAAKDALRDAEAAARAQAAGAGRIVTGQGGDMVFFATPTPLLVVDHLRRVGRRGWLSPYTAQVARWCGRSVWTTPGRHWPEALAAHNRSVAEHPWLAGAEDLPPAKQLQIATLAQKLAVHVEGLRGRAAEVIHPLMAQPVVELCLSIPAPLLTEGGRDRGLARRAFAERLPASVAARRSKGELGAYYGQVAAASLPMLRSYLLDGELVRAGLLDAERLEPLLHRDHLIWRGDYSALMGFAVIEAWVRAWTARLATRRPN